MKVKFIVCCEDQNKHNYNISPTMIDFIEKMNGCELIPYNTTEKGEEEEYYSQKFIFDVRKDDLKKVHHFVRNYANESYSVHKIELIIGDIFKRELCTTADDYEGDKIDLLGFLSTIIRNEI